MEPPAIQPIKQPPPLHQPPAIVRKAEPVHPAAPAVAAKKTFPSGGYNPTHTCPNCGKTQYVISGGAKGTTHTHTCASCGTSWYH